MKAWQMLFCLVASLFMAVFDTALALKPSPGCGKTPTLSGGTNVAHKLTVNNKGRQFYVNVPADYDKNHPYRLIFTLHALGGTASQVVAGTSGYYAWYGIPPLVNDTVGAIYVAPDGLNNGWANQGGEDVAFLSQVIQTVEADLCIDQDLRFSTGFSYGGAMSYSLACSLGSEIRAVAVLSGNPQISGCAGPASAPVAYYGEHGVSDNVLPISGGRAMRDRFVKNNGCTPQTPQEPAAGSGKHIKTTYTGCSAGHPVVWVAFDGPHTPTPLDSGASRSFAPAETWEFFSQFK
ncbi:Alpha/Beta hydrolase protein [Achaetomium macrosporum]|uniref:feruloyl esterase n=1 Tax=Achaetomium macrosporum TaxID=79813 RepID=A0AAN7HC24_9PEZI|nr:Alpha/Beta hydrolase protein [Achaetomium macrosporum]